MKYANFTFKEVPFEYKGKKFLVSGEGYAEVEIDGTYKYTPAIMYLKNGDPGYPAEEDYKIDSVELAGNIEIAAIELYPDEKAPKEEQPTDAEIEEIYNNGNLDFENLFVENLTSDMCKFDEEDCLDILREQEKEEW